MISTQNFMEIWFAVSTLWLVHCCRTTKKWPIPRVYGIVVQTRSTLLFSLPPPNLVGVQRDDRRLISLVSENHPCDIITTISPISIGGFLRIRKLKWKLPIVANVKFLFSRLWKKLEEGPAKTDDCLLNYSTHAIYVTIYLIFLNPCRRFALEKPHWPHCKLSVFPLKNWGGFPKAETCL